MKILNFIFKKNTPAEAEYKKKLKDFKLVKDVKTGQTLEIDYIPPKCRKSRHWKITIKSIRMNRYNDLYIDSFCHTESKNLLFTLNRVEHFYKQDGTEISATDFLAMLGIGQGKTSYEKEIAEKIKQKNDNYQKLWLYFSEQAAKAKPKFGEKIWDYTLERKIPDLEIEYEDSNSDISEDTFELLMVTRKGSGDVFLHFYSSDYLDFEEEFSTWSLKGLDGYEKEFERERQQQYLEGFEESTIMKLKNIKRLAHVSTYDLETGENVDIQETDDDCNYPEIDKIKYLESLGIQFNDRMLKAAK